ncbi:MAG: BtpA/SgcQ family protein [Acidimicrobiia bacterium]
MSPLPRVVGMVHLDPLPGSPLFDGSMGKLVERAVSDANALASAGFPSLLVENFGDVPFHADQVPSETVASMAVAVAAVKGATGLPVGVNVLRNDAIAALAVAAATGAEFIRVNVLTGVMYTDQGPIVGRAAEVMRLRSGLGIDTEVWADVMVKHAVAPASLDLRQAASDLDVRGLADAVLVSGSGTGREPSTDDLRTVRAAVDKDKPVILASGASPENLAGFMEMADGVIVGSYLKFEGDARRPVDPARAIRFIQIAHDLGLC